MLKMTLVRLVVFALAFAFGLPLIFAILPGASAVSGGILGAIGLSVAYLATLFVFAAIMTVITDKLKMTPERKGILAPLWGTLIFIVNVAFLLVTPHVVPSWLAIDGILPALLAGALLQILLIVTLRFQSPCKGGCNHNKGEMGKGESGTDGGCQHHGSAGSGSGSDQSAAAPTDGKGEGHSPCGCKHKKN